MPSAPCWEPGAERRGELLLGSRADGKQRGLDGRTAQVAQGDQEVALLDGGVDSSHDSPGEGLAAGLREHRGGLIPAGVVPSGRLFCEPRDQVLLDRMKTRPNSSESSSMAESRGQGVSGFWTFVSTSPTKVQVWAGPRGPTLLFTGNASHGSSDKRGHGDFVRGSRRKLRTGAWDLRVSLGKDPRIGKYRQLSRTFYGPARAADDALGESC